MTGSKRTVEANRGVDANEELVDVDALGLLRQLDGVRGERVG